MGKRPFDSRCSTPCCPWLMEQPRARAMARPPAPTRRIANTPMTRPGTACMSESTSGRRGPGGASPKRATSDSAALLVCADNRRASDGRLATKRLRRGLAGGGRPFLQHAAGRAREAAIPPHRPRRHRAAVVGVAISEAHEHVTAAVGHVGPPRPAVVVAVVKEHLACDEEEDVCNPRFAVPAMPATKEGVPAAHVLPCLYFKIAKNQI